MTKPLIHPQKVRDSLLYGFDHTGGVNWNAANVDTNGNLFTASKFVDTSGNVTGWKVADGKPRVSSMPYPYDIAEGNISGHAMWSKTGYNGDLDSGTEHIWAVGGTFVFPPSAMQLEVYSASANDTSDGTGVQQVQITYLDNTYAEKTEIVTLNGGTKATVATNILRVNNFRAYRMGANKVAAGIISLRETDDAPIYSQISLGATRARNSAVTVPLGKTLYITSCFFSAIGSATGKDVLFTARCSYDDKRGELIDFMMPFLEVGVMDGAFYRHFEVPIRLPATTDITVTGTAGTDNTIASCSLRGWIE